MDGHQNYTIERFVVEACEVLQIPLRRPSPTELELRVPPGLRRYFGNLDSVRTTTSSELRRLDPELDLLGPRSFAVECLSELLSGSESTWGVLVAGVPERVDPERYVRSFADRFLPRSDTSEHLSGRLPPGVQLESIEQRLGYRPLLRMVIDVRCQGTEPIHEVFPVLVCLRSLKAVPSNYLKDRRLYDAEEIGALREEVPELPARERIEQGIGVVASVARTVVESLVAQAQQEVLPGLRLEEEQITAYFHQQIREHRVEVGLLEAQHQRRVAQIRSRANVSTSVQAVLGTVIFEIVPNVRVTLRDRAVRFHSFDVPVIPGRPEIPDDAVVCGHVNSEVVLVPSQGLLCAECAPPCKWCECGVPESESSCSRCAEQNEVSCPRCVRALEGGVSGCSEHSYTCRMGELRLTGDEKECGLCGEVVCSALEHRLTCVIGGEIICAECQEDQFQACVDCGEIVCEEHHVRDADGELVCLRCSTTCTADGRIHRKSRVELCSCCSAEGQESFFCADHLEPVECTHGRVCQAHVRRSDRGDISICTQCVTTCAVCDAKIGAQQTVECREESCSRRVCTGVAGHSCEDCGNLLCPDHTYECPTTNARFCRADSATCGSCAGLFRARLSVDCEVCSTHLCPACVRESESAQELCAECVGTCAGGQELRAKRDLNPCTEHDDAAVLFCPEHSEETSCCHRYVCHEHVSRSIVSASTICRECGVNCPSCGGLLRSREGQRCSECDHVYCDTQEVAPRCAVGGEVVCQTHMRECVETGKSVCSEHSVSCKSCGVAISLGAELRCGICDSGLCANDMRKCVVCDSVCCAEHRGTWSQELVICGRCGVQCEGCENGTWKLRDDIESCALCRSSVCSEHRQTCCIDQRPLCREHAGSSVLHDGVFCSEHLSECSSCGLIGICDDSELCDLCQCFVRGTTDPDVLPFSIDLVNDAVKARGGLISRLAKARWRVGEKYVLIWIQSGVIRRDRFVILDHGGEAVDLCKPVRPRHLET